MVPRISPQGWMNICMAEHKLSEIFKERSLLSPVREGESASHIIQVLMDADGLVALVKEDDMNHSNAVDTVDMLEKRGVLFIITPFTVPECVTVLSYKVSHDTAREFLREVRTLELGEFGTSEFIGEIKRRADEVFLNETRKGTSYFDCVNIAMMERYKLDAIFSYDQAYRRYSIRYADEL